MKKIFIILLLTINMIFSIAYASEFNMNEFVTSLSKFENEFISSEEYSEIIQDIQQGDFNFDYKKIFDNLGKFFSKEIKNNIGILIQVVIIAILSGFLDNLKSSFSSDGVSKLAFYMCYIVAVTIIISSFIQIVDLATETIVMLIAFMDVFLPVMIGLLVSTGAITTTSMIYPLIIFVTNAISNFMNNFMIPIIMTAFGIGMTAHISEKIKISKISQMIKSISMWVLGILLTLFVGIVSLEGSIASTVDGITVKTAKFMFSNGVPVVGKLLGDSIDTILGSTLVLKDAVGFVGVLILLSLVLVPVLKIVVFLLLYGGVAALIEPFAESRLLKCMNETVGVGKVILAMVLTVSIMFIIGIVAMLKMTNNIAMFR